MEEEPDDKVDLDNVVDYRERLYSQVMEYNQDMWAKCRRQAKKALGRAEMYESMAEQERQIAGIHLMTATQLSEMLGDTVVSEFDLQIIHVNDEEMPDDVEEEDE